MTQLLRGRGFQRLSVFFVRLANQTLCCLAGKPAAAGRAQTFPDLHTALEEYSRTGDMSVLQGLSNFMGSPDQVCLISRVASPPE